MAKSTTSYELEIPTDAYNKLKKIAEQEGTTVAELMRRTTLDWMPLLQALKANPDARLLVEQGGKTTEIITTQV